MICRINFVSFAAALGLFFLPWLDFQCSGKSKITQSGFQTVTGGGSLGEEVEIQFGDRKNDESQGSFDAALYVAVALGCIVLGLLIAFIGLLGGGPPSPALPALAAMALILIGLQMKLEFPMEQKIVKLYQKTGVDGEAAAVDPRELLALEKIRIVYRPGIYFELGILVLPIGIAFFAMRST
jgi:hypothetical protein